MTIYNDDRSGSENRRHGSGLSGGEPHSYKPLPVASRKGAAWAKLVDGSSGKMNKFEYGSLLNYGCVQGCEVGDERHDGEIAGVRFKLGAPRFRQEIFNAEHLSGENSIKSGEAEAALAANEIRKMRWAQTRLSR